MERFTFRGQRFTERLPTGMGEETRTAEHIRTRAVDAVDADPPEVGMRVRRIEGDEEAVLPAGRRYVGRIQHVPVADRDRTHLLSPRVALRLQERCVNRAPVPGQGTRSFHFDEEVLDPQAGEQDVGVVDLVVDVSEGPVERPREEVRKGVLGDLLGGVAEPPRLREVLRPSALEGRPSRRACCWKRRYVASWSSDPPTPLSPPRHIALPDRVARGACSRRDFLPRTRAGAAR